MFAGGGENTAGLDEVLSLPVHSGVSCSLLLETQWTMGWGLPGGSLDDVGEERLSSVLPIATELVGASAFRPGLWEGPPSTGLCVVVSGGLPEYDDGAVDVCENVLLVATTSANGVGETCNCLLYTSRCV